MRRALLVVLSACGGDGSPPPDAGVPHDLWSWSCPPGASDVEIATWDIEHDQHAPCTNTRVRLVSELRFPCSAGEAMAPSGDITRLDMKTVQRHVYARYEGPPTHVEVVAPRGLVRLTVTRVNETTMLEQPCVQGEQLDVPWLGRAEAIDCQANARTTLVLPGQPVGTHQLEVLRQTATYCPIVSEMQTMDVTITADAIVDVAMSI